MRIGVCTSLDKAGIVADAGGDYVELMVVGDLMPESSAADWESKRVAIRASPVPVETFNIFLPGDIKIVGQSVDSERTSKYVATAFVRAAQVGASVIVLGSGGARRVPDDFSRDTARAQILRFLDLCAAASDVTGVVLAIEPLNPSECNIINSVAEGAGYVTACGKPGVRLLADSYHMEKDSEPIEEVAAHGAVLAHAHTADTARRAPGTGAYDHVAFFAMLRAGGYDGRVSIECRWDDFDAQVAPAIAYLRRFA